MPPWFMRQSCRIVNDRVFGHVCGGDHGHADRAEQSWATPRGPPRTPEPLRRGGAPRRPVRPAERGACTAGPLRAACALRTGAGVPDAMGAARALHPGKAREITWSAGWFRGTRGVRGPGPPGGNRSRIHTFRSGPRGEEPAVRRPARSLKRSAPPPPAPDDRVRRAEVKWCVRSRRRQPTRGATGLLSHVAPGHRDHRAWANLPTSHCRPRRTRRRGVAVGKLAGIRHYLPATPLVPMWKILWLSRVMSTTRVVAARRSR